MEQYHFVLYLRYSIHGWDITILHYTIDKVYMDGIIPFHIIPSKSKHGLDHTIPHYTIDGTIPLLIIPYVHCTVYMSHLSMEKSRIRPCSTSPQRKHDLFVSKL